MSKQAENKPLRRWVHEPGGDELDTHLGDVFRSLESEPGLPPSALAAVGRRLARGRVPVRRRSLTAAPLALVVLSAGASAAFAHWALPASWSVQRLLAPTPSAAASAPPTRSRPAASKPPVDAVQAPSEHDATSSPAVVEPARVPVAPAHAPPSVRPDDSATPSAIAIESELLQRALSALRRDRNATTALQLLDDYQARYPRGVLALEAAVARIDALLLAGRRAEALERLARLPLERVGRRSELQLVRAELYSERDCAKASADFSAVLAADAGGPLAERALYGRAQCRLRQADPAATADLRTYLARYPNGRFAATVREHLALTQE